MTTFVDTSAFYAAADSGDRSHSRATEVLSEAGRLITSDHVLVESWLLIRSRGGRAAAESFWAAIRSGLAAVETVSPGDLDAAWRIGEAFPDQDFSIVDRTSFAVMERLGLKTAFAFDPHFRQYGFQVVGLSA